MERAIQAGAAGEGPASDPVGESLREIKDLNLAYLLLVQRLMRENEAEALFRLGIGREVGRVLAALTPQQMVALARSNLVLCRFRLEDSMLLAALTGAEPLHALQNMHAVIVMAAQRG
ncbi:flagellar transcriptional regulator FlhD [Cupriavidus necator]|uniref:Flagellar transcriptional regulator FlhD n=1 Tax=Cupriavidus necator TaxID=106590 RepID=A0A367PQ61_CUPNE|nr:flagellar transcriptional regulator FlhD [Cupriavidus necator]QQX88808.1 flagellar transcriptional regulator FlhD [Cupriavidus necator]RCJ09694.1 flagellar transcriptional regulator FlhD [Cupriavidus necator]